MMESKFNALSTPRRERRAAAQRQYTKAEHYLKDHYRRVSRHCAQASREEWAAIARGE
jgi:hypothetical protein